MSESDSDLDFESADEDAEFASNIKKDVELEENTERHFSNQKQSVKPPKLADASIPDVTEHREGKLQVKSSSIESREEHIQNENVDDLTKEIQNIAVEELETEPVKRTIQKIETEVYKQEVVSESIADCVHGAVADQKSESKQEAVADQKSDSKQEAVADLKSDSKQEAVTVQKSDSKQEAVADQISDSKQEAVADQKTDCLHEAVADEKADTVPEPLCDKIKDNVHETLADKKADRIREIPDKKTDKELEALSDRKVDSFDEGPTGQKCVEKPRVMLRIEKKKQQKSQFSKEASVEKASDLVNILREEPTPQQPSSSWGFSSWSTSLLSTAASSVSTFSNQVTQGIETVFETMESTLGAPAPEDLATILREKKKEQEDKKGEEDSNVETESENAGLLPDVSSWTKVFENTGSKVLYGGLDTLELIGKKTMDMLTEGDPGLRKKRAVFSDKVNIAELLREARAKAEEQDQKDGGQKDTVHYSQIFDEKQGLVHLEALEMLSNQSQAKLQRLLLRHSKNKEVKKRLQEIKSICEDIPSVDDLSDCETFEDFETVFKKHTLELSLPVNVENIIKVQQRITGDINRFEKSAEEPTHEAKDIFGAAIFSLAEFTAKCIETFHKISELIIVQSNMEADVEHCVTNLTGMTTVMCIEVNNISSKYHKCLEAVADNKETAASSDEFNVTTMATNLYVEAANSNKYIQDAYLMLLPVLQVCLLENLE